MQHPVLWWHYPEVLQRVRCYNYSPPPVSVLAPPLCSFFKGSLIFSLCVGALDRMYVSTPHACLVPTGARRVCHWIVWNRSYMWLGPTILSGSLTEFHFKSTECAWPLNCLHWSLFVFFWSYSLYPGLLQLFHVERPCHNTVVSWSFVPIVLSPHRPH